MNKIICGHILPILKAMPDNYVDTSITSPPYWGLRDYGESTKVIWDEDKNCEHIWGKSIALHDNLRPSKVSKKTIVGSNKNLKFRTGKKVKSDFCSKCGAWYGQLGLEPTLDLYINHLFQITAELKRILKPTGVLFWDHGDCYGGSWQDYGSREGGQRQKNTESFPRKGNPSKEIPPTARLTAKCLALQNYRLILRMIDEQGWILRNDIKWHKPNHMPSSVKDRFANSYEPVFMLVKQSRPQYYYNTKTGLMADRKPKVLKEGIDWDWKEIEEHISENGANIGEHNKEPYKNNNPHLLRLDKKKIGKLKKTSYWKSLDYWFDLDAVRKPHQYPEDVARRIRQDKEDGIMPFAKDNKNGIAWRRDIKNPTQGPEYKGKWKDNQEYMNKLQQRINDARAKGTPHDLAICDPRGKNPGDVWTIPTQPCPEAHFATFPEKLVEPMIKAACPEWICVKCGKARVRITKPADWYKKLLGKSLHDHKADMVAGMSQVKNCPKVSAEYQTIGWTNCGCNAGWRSGITLDPFGGAMTTCVVAKKLRRDYIAVELNPEYVKIGQKRLNNTIRPML